MTLIPAGEFTIGSDDVDEEGLAKEFGSRRKVYYQDERPVRRIHLNAFFIDTFEVSNKAYNHFCYTTGYPPPPTWDDGDYKKGEDEHPVDNVNWYDAYEYCKWVGKRLPTEEEWEKAARGPDANRYPWGQEFNMKNANLDKGATVPSGSMPKDKSAYGVFDMGGNVMEWTSSWYKPYPGNNTKNDEYGEKLKILRGGTGSVVGHYNMGKIYSRSSFRHYYLPGGKGTDAGFRCAAG